MVQHVCMHLHTQNLKQYYNKQLNISTVQMLQLQSEIKLCYKPVTVNTVFVISYPRRKDFDKHPHNKERHLIVPFPNATPRKGFQEMMLLAVQSYILGGYFSVNWSIVHHNKIKGTLFHC